MQPIPLPLRHFSGNCVFEATVCGPPCGEQYIAPAACFLYKPAIRTPGSFTPGGDPGRANSALTQLYQCLAYQIVKTAGDLDDVADRQHHRCLA